MRKRTEADVSTLPPAMTDSSDASLAKRVRRQTEAQLVAGGLLIVLVVGGGLLWLFYGRIAALIAEGVLLLAVVLLGVLLLGLRLLDRWAHAE